MALDLLDTPVRMTWDLHDASGAGLGREALLTLAGRLVEGGLFFVTLDERPLLHAAAGELLERLHAGGCQVQAVCAGRPGELILLKSHGHLLAGVLLEVGPFLDAGRIDGDRLRAAVAAVRSAGCEPALAMTPHRENLQSIPLLLSLARELDITRIKLPNAKLGDSFQGGQAALLPRWDDLERFREQWSAAGIDPAAGPSLEIHDLFLWEILTPGRDQSRSEYGGCQAGNSLGHLGADGSLYPCAAWPVRLGSLLEQSLAELWQGPARFDLRGEVAVAPPGCRGCVDYDLCLGGCRGLAAGLNSHQGGRDLMCRGPRQRKS